MKRWLSILFVVALVFVSQAVGQVIIGPEDDPYEVDSTISHDPEPDEISGTLPGTGIFGSYTVDALQISQFDCGMFPYMCSYVDVLNSMGIPMSGMTADSFCVYQDGTPITGFTVEELTGDSCATSICLVIDLSGSMNTNNKIAAARNAAHTLVDNMDVYDRVAIVTFSNCYNVVQTFTSNKTLLHSKINTLSANGYTAAFDGIWKGVDITTTELGSKAVIAITDGMENYSQWCGGWGTPDGLQDHNFADDSTLICNLATGAGIPIYTISLGSDFDPQYLISFAGGTGGEYYHAPTGDDIDDIYLTIKTRLCSRYLICYDSPDTVQNGDWHTLQICRKDSTGSCTGQCDSASCQEVAPPVIVRTPATIGLDATCQRWDEDVQVCAWVTDLDTPQGDLTVQLFYRNADSVGYTSVTMTRTDSMYCYTIPGSELTCETDSIQYYVTASDSRVTVSSPPMAPTSHHAFPVCENHAPTVNAGSDQTINQCTAAEICWAVSYGDVDGNLETVTKIAGPGTFDGSQICFTPTGTLNYEFVLKAVDSCGLAAYDTVVVYYTLNQAPVANAGPDQSYFQCTPTEICWAASCTDAGGNLTSCNLIAGTGTYNGSQICFTPDTSGVYRFILVATDDCGATDADTAFVTVSLNTAPVCSVPNDTTIFQCTAAQVSLPYSASDVDGNFKNCQIISGPGSLVGGNWCYTPSGDQAVTVTLKCTDSCNAYCESSFTVTFDLNQAPTLTLPNDTTIFQCSPQEVCLPYTVSDPDAGQTTNEFSSTAFAWINSATHEICISPDVPGDLAIVVQSMDPCGAFDVDTIFVTFATNTAPVANAGADQSIFQCSPAAISWNASCSDVDGNLSTCELVSGVGSYNGSQISFTPTGSGAYDFILKATDACGAEDYDTVTITVTENTAPVMTAQADTSLFLCAAQEICVSYDVSDVDAAQVPTLVETMISGYGALNTSTNEVCFTPTVAGTYEFILGVTDACGAEDVDTVVVTVSFGKFASITCPGSAYNKFLCAADSIIQPLTITPASATVTVSEGIYANGALRFLASSAGTYNIEVIADESCGSDTCTVTFNVTFNTAPVANAGADQSVFQCSPAAISWNANCSDVNGNLSTCELVSGVGSYNGSQLSFTPTGSGAYDFILKATDACGAEDYDTVTITVTENTAPVMTAQADTSLFLCAAQEICVSYDVSDVDAAQIPTLVETMISGYGALNTSTNEVCFTPTVAGTYEFILGVTDACGAEDVDTVVVTVSFGKFASITCPGSAYNKFLCAADSIIQPLTITPTGATVTVSEGIYAGGALRFLASSAGTYNIEVIADESCGSDTCTVTFNVTFNTAPVANAGADQSVFQCSPAAISWNASCSDVDGNLSTCELVSGVGSYNGSQISFTPTGSGAYDFILKATDVCGAEDYDTVTVTVTENTAPVMTAQADTSLFLCAAQEICVSYDVSDVDAAQVPTLVETMISGYGALNTSTNEVCFTPTVAGTYEFILGVTDACGAEDVDTVVVTVSFGQFAVIDCPTEPISVSLCDTVEVCRMLNITPASATVSVSYGTYAGGQHCFTPDTSGTYIVEVIASASCGADTCQLVYNVDIGQAAEIVCPGTQNIFICEPGQVCIPISVVTPEATFTISPIGTYNAGTICFAADTSGHYEINVIAATDCGADTCDIIADIVINSAPVASDPTTPVDTFMCANAQVCYQFSATDVDGGALVWTKLSGNGAVSTSGNWCFNTAGDNNYSIVAKVTDSCGAADTVTMTYNVDINAAPVVTLPADTTVFVCQSSEYCIPFTVSDGDANISLIELVSGSGTVDIQSGTICFTPTTSGAYAFTLRATDACGAYHEDAITITVNVGEALTINCPDDTAIFLCASTEICLPVTISNDSLVTVLPTGYYDNGQVCFTPDTSGHYVLTVNAESICGSANCSFAVDVTLNSPPIGDQITEPIEEFICGATQFCYLLTASDVNGGVLSWTKVSGDGTVNDTGLWCINASITGSKTVFAEVADECGATDTISMTYVIIANTAPTVGLPADTSIFLCNGASYCFDYTVMDPDGNENLEELLSGPGTIDTVANQVCFTPTAAGNYQFVVKATDACGASGQDVINITVAFGVPAQITCAADTAVYLCEAGQVCRPVTVTPDTLVSVSPIGTYNSGEVCFDADTSGVYTLTVTAHSVCGDESCNIQVTVTIDSPPVADEPTTPVDTFLCASAQICHQFTATDTDGGSLVWNRLSGAGTIDVNGLWCFTPTAAGTYSVAARVADSCGRADTVSLSYNVVFNTDPIITLPPDTTFFLCNAGEYCFGYTVSDADDNIVLEELISGGGVIDTAANTVCFTPTMAGVWQFVVGVKDACGEAKAAITDTINVTVVFNSAPVANAGNDFSTFVCGASEICFPVSCSDIDNNLDTCYVASGSGILSGGQVCFTPTGEGTTEIVIAAVDICGLSDYDTVLVTATFNDAPVCTIPGDTTLFQCTPTLVSLPLGVTDADNNFSHWVLVDGPGAIVSGTWQHTPTGDEVDTVMIQAVDSCGATCGDSFIATFILNQKPVVNAGDNMTRYFCEPGETVCWPATCSDPDNNLQSCELISSYGEYDAGEICFYVSSGIEKSYAFIMEATDSCGLTARDTSWLTVEFNEPPTIDLPSDFQTLVLGMSEICFEADISDNDGNLAGFTVSPVGMYDAMTGEICFDADTVGTYEIVVTATDSCGAVAVDTVVVTVDIDECLFVQIEKSHGILQGHYTQLAITLNGSGKKLGGFDLLITYDPSALIPANAVPGALFTDCDWEYFTYRFGAGGNCEGCPTGLMRIVGLAETTNGAYHPTCDWQGEIGTIANINFYVTSDYTMGGQYAPVEFFWLDCSDNSFSSVLGDTLWVSRVVYDLEWNNITDNTYGFPGKYGVPDYCLDGGGDGKPRPERCIDFTNGGVDIIHPDSIDDRGDINLNGIPNEIADAVMLTNFFIFGTSAFGDHVEGSIAASDVNADGTALTIADLVYLTRIIIGDAVPYAKPVPNCYLTVHSFADGQTVTIDYDASDNIGAVLLVFKLNGTADAPILAEAASDVNYDYNIDNDQMRILVHDIGTGFVPAGSGRLMTIPVKGTAELVEVEAADYYGRPLNASAVNIPKVFALNQNYPNPFNPTTTIRFSLPEASNWKLTVYNILGQVVETWNGRDEAGQYEVTWNADHYATGVYLYKLEAGTHTQAKKMILLK
ncbi:MAG: T9SS type A sorting domain-containing protein [Candidatus Zixiibacteriota bacterium]